MMDAIRFWIAKEIAEYGATLSIVALILLCALLWRRDNA